MKNQVALKASLSTPVRTNFEIYTHSPSKLDPKVYHIRGSASTSKNKVYSGLPLLLSQSTHLVRSHSAFN